MSEIENEVTETENEGVTTGAPETPAWSGPSQEEWEQTREAIQQVTGIVPTVQQMSQIFQQMQQGEEQEEDLDIGEYVERIIEGRLAPVMSVVQNAAQRSGQDKMKELLSGYEKDLGKFDHDLAERAAHSFFAESGDPVKSVEAGAKLAAEYRKREREDAVKEYKDSLKRPGPADLPVDGSGDRTIKPAKSYDEVVERWSAQTEL